MLTDYLQVWIVKIIESVIGIYFKRFPDIEFDFHIENLYRFADLFFKMRHPLVIRSLVPFSLHDIDQSVESFDHFLEPDWMVCETSIVV
jgi:hypothetical protein